MAILTIPWDVFLKTINRGKSESVEEWLSRWVFTNDGAALIGECGTAKNESLSKEEKQGVLILVTKGKWQHTLH
jgi:hypothetical protein